MNENQFFKIVQKDDGYYSRYSSFSNVRPMTKEYVQKHTAEIRTPLKTGKNFVVKETSGSTGIPLKVYKTRGDQFKQNLQLWRIRKKYGISVNDRSLFCYLNSRNKDSRATGYKTYKERELIININPFLLCTSNAKKIVDKIESFQPVFCMMPPSALQLIIEYCKLNNRSDALQSLSYVELISEPLLSGQKDEITHFLPHAHIVQQYGCTEVGIIGMDNNLDGKYEIFNKNVFVETLVNGNVGTNYNQSGEIMVTGLNTRGMPFIRYLLGDVGCLMKDNEGKESLQLSVGRKNDLICFEDGTKIHSAVLTKIIDKINYSGLCILKFQFVQSSYDVMSVYLKINDQCKKSENDIRTEFVQLAEALNLNCFQWNLNFVNAISDINQKGKLKYFISHVNSQKG